MIGSEKRENQGPIPINFVTDRHAREAGRKTVREKNRQSDKIKNNKHRMNGPPLVLAEKLKQ